MNYKNVMIKKIKDQDISGELYIPKKFVGIDNYFPDPRINDPNPIGENPNLLKLKMRWDGIDSEYRSYDLKNFRKEFHSNNDTRIAGSPKLKIGDIIVFIKNEDSSFIVKTIDNRSDCYSDFLALLDMESYKLMSTDNFNTVINSKINGMNPPPLNQILYGPPGTGKTYKTINEAIKIIDPTFNFNIERKDLLEEFHRHLKKGNIFFTTFHQSMSYEDFIEGIKPSKSNDGGLTYEIEDGIFKLACANAGYLCYKKSMEINSEIKSYTFDDLYDAFIDYYQELLDNQQLISLKTLTGKEVTIIEINSNHSIQARALNSIATKKPAPLTKENLQKLYDKFSTISEITNLKQVQETVEVTPRITEFYAVFNGLKDFEKTIFKPEELEVSSQVEVIDDMDKLTKFNAGVFKNAIKQYSKITKPIVLIIDEINRGNISATFGELITLIEDSKRLGADEFLEITLPYSKKKFSVPHNLYIIGTMNTADRSVEALDTALRRRFSFVEMLPDASKLNGKEIPGINLELLLNTMNERIEALVDRDHTIGHAFFMDVNSIDSLKNVFANKVIPLLQEYFYGDYAKMEMVIGPDFFNSEKRKKKVTFAIQNEDIEIPTGKYELINILDKKFDFVSAINRLLNRKTSEIEVN